MKKMKWSKHYSLNNWAFENWVFETDQLHVAGSVEQTTEGFAAGVAIPYQVNEDGEEQDWQPLGIFPALEDAKKAVEENATMTVQGERLTTVNGKLVAI